MISRPDYESKYKSITGSRDDFGLADLLHPEPKTTGELARSTRTYPPALERVLRALGSVGIVAEDGSGRFTLTALGTTLRSDVPGSLRSWALAALGIESRSAWGEILHTLRTGEAAFDHAFGTDIWKYRAQHRATADTFDDAMGQLVNIYNAAVVAAYSFERFGTAVDVGGGNGAFLVTLLQTYPRLRGTLVDLPHVAEKATRCLATADLSERCDVVAGDAFVSVPEGGDVYLLCRVLHDWSDGHATAILRNCRKAMREDATLLIVERVLPDRIDETASVQSLFISDLHMMVMNGGRERTPAAFSRLLAEAGFSMTRIVTTASVMQVVEAVPA